jgi:Protein of unknown function (DUF2442)
MSSLQPGEGISQIAVTDISPDGIWVLASGEEYFLPFDQFPWFKNGTIDQVLNVVEEQPGSYHWPELDVDLGLDSIKNPEQYPLKATIN